MKVGVVTITNGPCNYGNQLQNCAVVSVLESMGVGVNTLFFVYNAEYLASMKHKIKNIVFSKLKCGDYIQAKRELAFERFFEKYINYTKPIKKVVPQELIDSYDFFIAGSDQVWNPDFSTDETMWNYFLLSFAPPEKRVSFAASISVPNIPRDKKDAFVDALSDFKAISVREEAGAELIKKLTGREVETIIDPTLMMDKEEWEKISEKPENINTDKKYVLTYVLGNKNDKIEKQINELKQNGYEIYRLLDKRMTSLFITNPAEFIYLISKASLVLTDSFHACVFSFLYDVPFLVYAREGQENKMMSRIETLLSKFHMERKYVDSGLENDIFEHDYSKGKSVLREEQRKAMLYLKEALNL